MSGNIEWRKFPPETLQQLLAAVDEDDLVDENISLPDVIDLHGPQKNIQDNYALCLQYWEEGFTREELLDLINKLLNEGHLSEAERLKYKLIRSRYKHLRFAQRLYCQHHASSMWFSKTTVFLGKLQDAFRHDDKKNLIFYARILRFYLSPPVWKMVNHSLRQIKLDTEQDFIAYCQGEMHVLNAFIRKPLLSGKEFHTVRKIISQQVSWFDTLRTLNPQNLHLRQVSRYLAAINGLMGDRHDEMVRDSLTGRNAYDSPARLDNDIRQRLALWLERYPW